MIPQSYDVIDIWSEFLDCEEWPCGGQHTTPSSSFSVHGDKIGGSIQQFLPELILENVRRLSGSRGFSAEQLPFMAQPSLPPQQLNRRRRRKGPNYCVFCKKNNELPCFFRSHVLKDDCGRVVCPVLRIYRCPICSASGDTAHTVSYCPQRNAVLTLPAALSSQSKSSQLRAIVKTTY